MNNNKSPEYLTRRVGSCASNAKNVDWIKRLTSAIIPLMLVVIGSTSANADIIDLSVTMSWLEADYDVTSTGPDSPTGVPEEDDDKVFGTAASDGSTTFVLRVNTSSAISFMTGDFGIAHDWFGYSDVELLGGHSFGSASWVTDDILTGLVGPNTSSAALWTDTDIATTDPSRLSFRMFGDWEGASADLFLGSRTSFTISGSALLWEYFGGEEIRSNSYSATTGAGAVAVPEPGSLTLFGLGLLALGQVRNKKKSR